jgi:hypothetical protein
MKSSILGIAVVTVMVFATGSLAVLPCPCNRVKMSVCPAGNIVFAWAGHHVWTPRLFHKVCKTDLGTVKSSPQTRSAITERSTAIRQLRHDASYLPTV